MSRSGYIDSFDCGTWALVRWRGAVNSATKGKRGQEFFKALLKALDDMEEKKLIANELELNGEFCTLGVLGNKRGFDLSKIDPQDPDEVSKIFNIAPALAQEIVFMNDEFNFYKDESPKNRWTRMRKWVADQIIE